MSYRTTYCGNQTRKAGNVSKDENGYPYIYCKITNALCVAQRWCPEQHKHIISERANRICKNYKG